MFGGAVLSDEFWNKMTRETRKLIDEIFPGREVKLEEKAQYTCWYNVGEYKIVFYPPNAFSREGKHCSVGVRSDRKNTDEVLKAVEAFEKIAMDPRFKKHDARDNCTLFRTNIKSFFTSRRHKDKVIIAKPQDKRVHTYHNRVFAH